MMAFVMMDKGAKLQAPFTRLWWSDIRLKLLQISRRLDESVIEASVGLVGVRMPSPAVSRSYAALLRDGRGL